jgi:hypothetical protein
MVQESLQVENDVRKAGFSVKSILGFNPTFKDLIKGCATKWIEIESKEFDNPLFAEWQKRNLEN